MQKVQIVVCGRVNTGKTTLCHSLLNKEVGEKGDRAGVTTLATPVVHPEIRGDNFELIIIDCPGFTRSSSILDKLYDNIDIDDFDPKRFAHQIEAIRAIDSADIIIYTVSPEVVPDEDYEDELAIIRVRRPTAPLLGLINKVGLVRRVLGKDPLNNRLQAWIQLMNDHGCTKVVQIDAHREHPRDIKRMYEEIANMLPEQKRIYFNFAISTFWQNKSKNLRQAYQIAVGFIRSSIQTRVSQSRKWLAI